MTEGGKEVALVVGKPPPQKNPVLKAVIFLKKKKILYPGYLYSPITLTLWRKLGDMCLKKVHGLRIPKRPREFCAKVPRFSVILDPPCLPLREGTRQHPTFQPLAPGGSGDPRFLSRELIKFLPAVVF